MINLHTLGILYLKNKQTKKVKSHPHPHGFILSDPFLLLSVNVTIFLVVRFSCNNDNF